MKDASPNDDDRQFDLTLRPTRIEEYIGQRQVKENLRVYMKAARHRREAMKRSASPVRRRPGRRPRPPRRSS